MSDPVASLEGHQFYVTCAKYSPDGTKIASCSEDRTVRLWDVATGKCITTIKAHNSGINSLSFSPDGNLVRGATARACVFCVLYIVACRDAAALFFIQCRCTLVRSIGVECC